MMPFSRKLSLAAMLCLSVAMIVCALIRMAGSIADTKTGTGAAPVWDMYWAVVESCVSLTMASVIVIRGVFITTLIQDDRKKQESMFQNLGRRILSTLRLSGSSRSSRRSPQRSGYRSQDDQSNEPNVPKIGTQDLPNVTLSNIRTVIRGGRMPSQTRDDALQSVDTNYVLEDMDYHNIRKAEASKPSSSSAANCSETPL
jgi:hypothetical protein